MPLLGGRPMTAPTGCFGFSTKTNGEPCSPLQYKNNKTAVQIFAVRRFNLFTLFSYR